MEPHSDSQRSDWFEIFYLMRFPVTTSYHGYQQIYTLRSVSRTTDSTRFIQRGLFHKPWIQPDLYNGVSFTKHGCVPICTLGNISQPVCNDECVQNRPVWQPMNTNTLESVSQNIDTRLITYSHCTGHLDRDRNMEMDRHQYILLCCTEMFKLVRDSERNRILCFHTFVLVQFPGYLSCCPFPVQCE